MANVGKLLLFGDKLFLKDDKAIKYVTPDTPLPTIGVDMTGSSVVLEGEGAAYTFTVSLSTTATEDTTFTYTTVNGTGQAGTDYAAIGGTGTIPQGELSVNLTVNIINDLTYRGDRTFSLTISNAATGPDPIVITNSTRTVTITEDDEAPVDPPPPAGEGSPLVALEHPRLVFVPENSNYVFGRKLSTFRTRMATATYSSGFQAYINTHVARFNSTISTKTSGKLVHDGMAYACFAMLDPATMPTFNFTYTKQQFIDKAKEHLSQLCSQYLMVGTGESGQDSSSEDGGGPKTMAAAMMYDWIMAADSEAFTIPERQVIAEAAIDAWKDSASPGQRWLLSENSHYHAWRGIALAVALYGDPISGNSTKTGLPYSTDINTAKDLFITRLQYMHDSAEFFRDGQGIHQESDAYYGLQWTKTASWATVLGGTALNTNYFYEYGWWRNRVYYMYMMGEPCVYSTTLEGVDNIPSRRLIKADTTAGNDHAIFSTILTRSAPFMEGWDDRRHSICKWIWSTKWNTSSPYNSTSVIGYGDQLIYRFAFGMEHVTPIEPVAEVDIPKRLDGGLGRIILRDSVDPWEVGSTAIVYNNIKHRIGGHQHVSYNNALWMYKWGTICGEGGTGKTTGINTGSSGTNPYLQGNAGRPWAGDVFCLHDKSVTTRNTAGITYGANNASLNPDVCIGCNCGIGNWTIYHMGSGDGAAVFLVNASNTMSTSKGSYYARQFVWFTDESGAHDYVVVWDRATKHSTNNIMSMTSTMCGTRPELVDGSWTLTLGPGTAGTSVSQPTGEWTGTGSVNCIKLLNEIDQADSVCYITVLKPSSPVVYAVGGNAGWWGADVVEGVRNKESGSYVARDCGNVWAPWYGRYRLEIKVDSAAGSQDEILRVMQLSRASTTPTPTDVEYITSTNGAMGGAAIMDSARTRVALTPVAHGFTTVSSSFTFNLPSGATTPARIVCSRVSPSTAYSVSRVGLAVTVTLGSGGSTTTADGVLEAVV
jgi:hypothetical protein